MTPLCWRFLGVHSIYLLLYRHHMCFYHLSPCTFNFVNKRTTSLLTQASSFIFWGVFCSCVGEEFVFQTLQRALWELWKATPPPEVSLAARPWFQWWCLFFFGRHVLSYWGEPVTFQGRKNAAVKPWGWGPFNVNLPSGLGVDRWNLAAVHTYS